MLEIGLLITTNAMGLIGIALWVFNLRRVAAGNALVEPRIQRGSPLGFADVILLYFFWAVGNLIPTWMVCQSLGIEIGEIASLKGDSQAMFSIAQTIGLLTGTLLAFVVYRLRYGPIGLAENDRQQLTRDLVLGLSAGVMVIPFVLLFQSLIIRFIPYQHSTLEMLADKPSFWVIAATWFSAVVAAPICEEVFFRGILQGWLQRIRAGVYDCILVGGWDSVYHERNGGSLLNVDGDQTGSMATSRQSNSVWPMVVSSFLFGMAHYGQGPAPITLFFFGLVLGYLFRKTGSVIPCIVLHIMLNGFTMFWFTLQMVYGDAPTAGLSD
jgi:membrane protease YdiL (CAAX protease family)